MSSSDCPTAARPPLLARLTALLALSGTSCHPRHALRCIATSSKLTTGSRASRKSSTIRSTRAGSSGGMRNGWRATAPPRPRATRTSTRQSARPSTTYVPHDALRPCPCSLSVLTNANTGPQDQTLVPNVPDPTSKDPARRKPAGACVGACDCGKHPCGEYGTNHTDASIYYAFPY